MGWLLDWYVGVCVGGTVNCPRDGKAHCWAWICVFQHSIFVSFHVRFWRFLQSMGIRLDFSLRGNGTLVVRNPSQSEVFVGSEFAGPSL